MREEEGTGGLPAGLGDDHLVPHLVEDLPELVGVV